MRGEEVPLRLRIKVGEPCLLKLLRQLVELPDIKLPDREADLEDEAERGVAPVRAAQFPRVPSSLLVRVDTFDTSLSAP